MTTWAYQPNSHPWFRDPSLKRKTLEDDDISVVEFPEMRPLAPCPKRRRCDNIEHRLAHMKLDRSSVSPPPPPPIAPTLESPSALQLPQNIYAEPIIYTPLVHPASSRSRDFTPCMLSPVILPSSVEEPASPEQTQDIPDVRMKIPSWYEAEKDRVVITDLEDSDSDSEDQQSVAHPGENAAYTVSSALLDRLPLYAPSLPVISHPESSKALVLFRPLVITGTMEPERDEEDGRHDVQVMESDVSNTDMDTMMEVDDAMGMELL